MGLIFLRFSFGFKILFVGNIEIDCNWVEEIFLGGFVNFIVRVELGVMVILFSVLMVVWVFVFLL